jgi:hypothetical protein
LDEKYKNIRNKVIRPVLSIKNYIATTFGDIGLQLVPLGGPKKCFEKHPVGYIRRSKI